MDLLADLCLKQCKWGQKCVNGNCTWPKQKEDNDREQKEKDEKKKKEDEEKKKKYDDEQKKKAPENGNQKSEGQQKGN